MILEAATTTDNTSPSGVSEGHSMPHCDGCNDLGPLTLRVFSNCSTQTTNVLKASPYSITERRVPELIPALGSQPACDVSHKPSGRLPLLSARPAVTPATNVLQTNTKVHITVTQITWHQCIQTRTAEKCCCINFAWSARSKVK